MDYLHCLASVGPGLQTCVGGESDASTSCVDCMPHTVSLSSKYNSNFKMKVSNKIKTFAVLFLNRRRWHALH